jgi:hypothetical protein
MGKNHSTYLSGRIPPQVSARLSAYGGDVKIKSIELSESSFSFSRQSPKIKFAFIFSISSNYTLVIITIHSCYNSSTPCFLAEAGKEDACFALQKRIQALDQEIDARVYSLYGLTEAEIKVVEGR